MRGAEQPQERPLAPLTLASSSADAQLRHDSGYARHSSAAIGATGADRSRLEEANLARASIRPRSRPPSTTRWARSTTLANPPTAEVLALLLMSGPPPARESGHAAFRVRHSRNGLAALAPAPTTPPRLGSTLGEPLRPTARYRDGRLTAVTRARGGASASPRLSERDPVRVLDTRVSSFASVCSAIRRRSLPGERSSVAQRSSGRVTARVSRRREPAVGSSLKACGEAA
jgi:hypothetical protein